jgi:hypothetical protein
MNLKRYELIKDLFNIKAGQVFLQDPDTSYHNLSNTCKLTASIVETDKEYFKEITDPPLWKPAIGETFYIVTLDGGVTTLQWEEPRHNSLYVAGNVFKEKNQAEEISQAIAVLIRDYHKKFQKK